VHRASHSSSREVTHPHYHIVFGWQNLANELGIARSTLFEIHTEVDLQPYRYRNRVAFMRAHLPLLVEKIYYSAIYLRPTTLATLFNSIFGLNMSSKNFKRVNGRWILR